jgi:hypothetical protein
METLKGPQRRITAAVENVDGETLTKLWQEMDYFDEWCDAWAMCWDSVK